MRLNRFRILNAATGTLILLTLLLPGWLNSVSPVSAQTHGGMVIGAITCDAPNTECRSEIGAQFTVTTEDGTYVGSCTVEGNPNDNSHVAACLVTFPFEITGTLVVTENVDTVTPGYVPEENPISWEIPVNRASHDVVFRNLPVGGSVATETSNIAIVTTENGSSVTDVCYVLASYGNIGCDDNGDGKITFQGVPLGTYSVHQTADLGPGRSVDHFTITVTGAIDGDGWERFNVTVVRTGNSPSSTGSGATAQEIANGGPWLLGITARIGELGSSELLLGAHFTVTSEDGDYIGECTLTPIDREVGWLNCKVDVPSDRVSLVWLDLNSVPAGYEPIENPITFDPTTYIAGPHNIGASFTNFPLTGSTEIETVNPSGSRDIALITRDPDDGHLLTDGCFILLEYGNEGCDENGDGQITYADVPFGVYTVHQTQTPSGYPTVTDFQITVTDEYPQIALGYVVRQATVQNTPGARNLSVVFIDSRTHTKVESSICAKLAGGSELACDDALVDGQIDFLDVPAGTYPIEFTGLPAGWQLLTSGTAGPSATISADSSNPSNQFVFVEVVVPGSDISMSDSSPGGGIASGGSANGTQRTWTAAVTVILCDSSPSDAVTNCRGGAGIVVNFSLASGEFLGACTTGAPVTTPWGPTTISTCSVDGMPFNSEIVAKQDPSTIPANYVPLQETSVVRAGSTHPGGGDGTPFAFTNYAVANETQSVPSSSDSSDAPAATLLMTFRGCPEGFDPAVQDFFANCIIPLDAPDASFIFWGAEGQGGMNIAWLERQFNGAYIYNAWPLTMNVQLSGLAPVVRDAYQVIGADSASGSTFNVHLVDGEVREVFVFYYFE